MPNWTVVTAEHVKTAIAEYDKVGGDEFLANHGFGGVPSSVINDEGKYYDSKAILSVAHGYATGEDAAPFDFSGGNHGAATVLIELGFHVELVGDEAAGTDLSLDAARLAWTEAAREHLLVTANKYQAVTTYKELAASIQEGTSIRTKQMLHHWISDVLTRVSVDCAQRDEPLLASLCVNADGSVGVGYAVAVTSVRGEAPADGDDHAARERLACHEYFGANMPANGGVAVLTSRLAASRARLRKIAIAERKPTLCPKCQIAVPPSGFCDTCD